MKYADEILKEIEERGTVDTTNYIIDDGWEDYIRKRKFTDKILNYILTFLLKRAKVVYREYWTSKQISQIDSIIYKLKYIIDN